MATKATPKQLFALFCATKVNTKFCNLTLDEASILIQKSKNGENIIEELVRCGGIQKVTEQKEVVKKDSFQELYDKAHKAGMNAANNHNPTPMIVTERVNPLNDNSPIKNSYYVPSGMCGFAWINVKPGNSPFANWLKKNKLADKSYEGGVTIWVSYFGQSIELKEKYAYAFAEVLRQNGVERAYAGSRLD